jgi:hypothetical protein
MYRIHRAGSSWAAILRPEQATMTQKGPSVMEAELNKDGSGLPWVPGSESTDTDQGPLWAKS